MCKKREIFYIPDGTFAQISAKICNLCNNENYITGHFLIQNLGSRGDSDFYISLYVNKFNNDKIIRVLSIILVNNIEGEIQICPLPYHYFMQAFNKEDYDSELVKFFDHITKRCEWIIIKKS